MDSQFVMTETTMQKVLQVLSTLPYGQVNTLIQEIMQQINASVMRQPQNGMPQMPAMPPK